MKQMASDAQRQAVWLKLLQYESLQRYYSAVSARLAWQDKALTVGLLTGASAAAAALLVELNPLVGKLLAVTVACLSVWSALSRYGERSAMSASIALEFGRLGTEVHRLWLKVDELDDDQVERLWSDLDLRAADATRWAPSNLLGYERLQDASEKETYEYWKGVNSAEPHGSA